MMDRLDRTVAAIDGMRGLLRTTKNGMSPAGEAANGCLESCNRSGIGFESWSEKLYLRVPRGDSLTQEAVLTVASLLGRSQAFGSSNREIGAKIVLRVR